MAGRISLGKHPGRPIPDPGAKNNPLPGTAGRLAGSSPVGTFTTRNFLSNSPGNPPSAGPAPGREPPFGQQYLPAPWCQPGPLAPGLYPGGPFGNGNWHLNCLAARPRFPPSHPSLSCCSPFPAWPGYPSPFSFWAWDIPPPSPLSSWLPSFPSPSIPTAALKMSTPSISGPPVCWGQKTGASSAK